MTTISLVPTVCPCCGQPLNMASRLGLRISEGAIIAKLHATPAGEWVSTWDLFDAYKAFANLRARDVEAVRQGVHRIRKKLGDDFIDSRARRGYRLSPEGRAHVSLIVDVVS